MKLIIAGTRTFTDYELLKSKLDNLLRNIPDIDTEIVSGGCKGADLLGEQYAKEFGIKIKRFPADWDKHGKKAGPLRNKEMAEYSTHCVVFWDGLSKGTASMIKLAQEKELNLRVINY